MPYACYQETVGRTSTIHSFPAKPKEYTHGVRFSFQCYKIHSNQIKMCGCQLFVGSNYHPNQWASCQIRKIVGCACAGNAGNVFPTRRLQRKPLVSDPGMHHSTCVTHVPWCMSGLLTCGGGENVPGIPGACAPAVLRIWQEAHGPILSKSMFVLVVMFVVVLISWRFSLQASSHLIDLWRTTSPRPTVSFGCQYANCGE